MPTSYWLKFGNTPLGYNGSGVQFTHVEQPGSLTVSLVGTGTGFDNAKNFNVLVTFGSAISYSVDGVPVQSPSATCTLTLHAGQSSVISNIPFGTTYTITETVSDEGYELSSITNASGTMTDGGSFSSVVTNAYHAPGQLTIGVLLSGTGYDPAKTFAFTVTFNRAITYKVNGTAISTPSSSYSGSLASGGSVVLGDVPYGVTYAVTENALPSSDVTAGYSTGSVTNGSGTMTDGGSVNVTANYAYSIPRSNVLVLQNKANSATTFTFRYGSQGATTSFKDKDVGYMVNGVQYTSGGTSFSVSVPANSSVNLEVIDAGAAGPSADTYYYLRVYGSADGTTRIYGDGEQYPWGSVSASGSRFGTILLFNYAWFYDSSRTLPVARIER